MNCCSSTENTKLQSFSPQSSFAKNEQRWPKLKNSTNASPHSFQRKPEAFLNL